MKSIKFNYEDRDYTLCYTRESVKTLEKQGFDFEKISTMPVTMIPDLFYGAFFHYHKGIKRKLVDDIWESIGNKEQLIVVLGEMYADTINSLMSSPEDDSKNTMWELTD